MIAIGVRRNIQITPTQFDFDQRGLEEADFTDEQDNSQVYSASTKGLLARIITAQCELAVAQTPTMMAAYHVDSSSTPEEAPESSVQRLLTSMTEIERAKTELTIWARRFKSALIVHADGARGATDTSASITLFADMTLIHYL